MRASIKHSRSYAVMRAACAGGAAAWVARGFIVVCTPRWPRGAGKGDCLGGAASFGGPRWRLCCGLAEPKPIVVSRSCSEAAACPCSCRCAASSLCRSLSAAALLGGAGALVAVASLLRRARGRGSAPRPAAAAKPAAARPCLRPGFAPPPLFARPALPAIWLHLRPRAGF